MIPRFFAKFSSGRANLCQVFAKSETEKVIKLSHKVEILGYYYYLPDNIRKSEHNIFPDMGSALAYLITQAEGHREEIKKALAEAHKQVDDLIEMARKLKEGEV